jgi:hypothetical protein
MLLCDGYGSHLTYEFIQFCEKQRIVLFFIPPHSSHLLQPLDVGVFHVYKHWHSEMIEDMTITGCTKFTKDDFLAAITSIRQKTFKASTIRLGFRLTGIWPYNPGEVVDNLFDYRNSPDRSTDQEDSSKSQRSEPTTPKTAGRIRQLSKRLDQMEKTSTDFQIGLQKLAKSAEIFAYQAHEWKREVRQLELASSIRSARIDHSGRRSKLSGIVSSEKVARIKKREHKLGELEDLMRLKPKWKKVMKELKQRCILEGRRLK